MDPTAAGRGSTIARGTEATSRHDPGAVRHAAVGEGRAVLDDDDPLALDGRADEGQVGASGQDRRPAG